MSVLKEFRDFALRGNVVDLAVGVVIGAAFGKIVSSLVADVIMPPLGLLLGGVHVEKLHWVLKPAAGEQVAVTLNYGTFLQTCIDFTLIAAAIFALVKAMNSLKRAEAAAPPPAPPAPSAEETLLREIRDLLKDRR